MKYLTNKLYIYVSYVIITDCFVLLSSSDLQTQTNRLRFLFFSIILQLLCVYEYVRVFLVIEGSGT